MSVTRSRQRLAVTTPEGDKNMVYQHWHSPSSQQVLVCCHGLTHNGRFFDEVAQVLADRYQVICPDVLGRGDSDWLDNSEHYGYPLYLSNAEQLLQHLRSQFEVQQVDWLGTSMGGLIGMLLEATQPGSLRKLVLNDVGIRIPLAALQRIGSYVGKGRQFPSLDEAEAEFRIIASPFGALTEAQWRTLTMRMFRQDSQGDWCYRYDPGIALAFERLEHDVDLSAAWSKVTCPVLVLRGSNSDVLTVETAAEMAERQGVDVIEMTGCGHAPVLMENDQIQLLQHYLSF